MVDALITFEEGEDILASETNSNNNFLLGKINDNAEQLQNYLTTQIASIQSNIASVQSTLQNNINAVKSSALTSANKVTITQWGMPKYSSRAARAANTVYTASGNGYIQVQAGTNDSSQYFVYVDNVEVGHSYGWKYVGQTTVTIPVGKGSKYVVNNVKNLVTYFWVPAQGG